MEKKYLNLMDYGYSLKYYLFQYGKNDRNQNMVALNNVIDYSSSTLSLNKLENNYGEFPLFGADGLVKNIDFFDKDEEYISIVKDGNGVGRLTFNNKKTSVVGTMGYLTLKGDNNLRFIYYAMSLINLEKYIIGSTIPHIYYKDYSKEKIYLPSVKTQNKIVDIMLSIDIKIQNLKREIELNKEFKHSLLSKMFC